MEFNSKKIKQNTIFNEENYKNWVENDYSTWSLEDESSNTIKDSSTLYESYLNARNVIPPEKYKNFHDHYLNSYYFFYKMMKATENKDDTSFAKYRQLESEEETELWKLSQKLGIKLIKG